MSRSLLPVLLISVLAPLPAEAQHAQGGIVLEHFTFTDPGIVAVRSIALRTAPLSVRLSLAGIADLAIAGGFASATQEWVAGRAEISGPVDTRIGVSRQLKTFRFTVGGVLPTGATERSSGETALLGALAAETLPFTALRWGSGSALTADVSWAVVAGATSFGLGVGYETAASFEIDPTRPSNYEPGPHWRSRFFVDRGFGSGGSLALSGGVQVFGEDALAATNLFVPGIRVDGALSYAFPFGARESTHLFATVHSRTAGSATLAPRTAPFDATAQTAVLGLNDSAARLSFTVGADLRVDRGSFTVLPESEFRIFQAKDARGDGWLAAVGTSVEWRVSGGRRGRRVVAVPSARLLFGAVTSTGGVSSRVGGWSAGLSLRYIGGAG